MAPSFSAGNSDFEKILERIHVLEERMETMESRYKLTGFQGTSINASASAAGSFVQPDDDLPEVDEVAIESRIGEYGLAWLGSLVLLFGIIFLMTFVNTMGFPVAATGIGYGSAASVFVLGYFLRSFSHMKLLLNISAHLLSYYVTLRLYFFTPHPLIYIKEIDIVLLIIVAGIQIFLAVRKSSELLMGIALILVVATALISDSLHITLPIITLVAVTALYFFYRFNWWRLLVVSLFLVYFSQIMWLSGNPLLGHPFELIASHPYNMVYLFACGAIYSVSTLFRRSSDIELKGVNSIVLLNGLFFTLTILPVTVIYYCGNYVGMFGVIAVFCILFSMWLHMKRNHPFVPAFFACFGFMALSVSFYGFAKIPDAYFFLALQSLLVVSMALWFRSKIIVVVNSILYMGMLLAYLLNSYPVDRISFCFAFMAFATARILNLKKERLTLKTDLMRNMYLVALFFTILYAFYHAVPGKYITLSWTAVAAGYFLISFLLHNIKYRWMAITTLLVTVVYLFMVDLSNLSIGYRVMAFLFLAVISISASLYYTQRIKKKKSVNQEVGSVAE